MDIEDKLLLDYLREEIGLVEPILKYVELDESVIYYTVEHISGLYPITEEYNINVYELITFMYKKLK